MSLFTVTIQSQGQTLDPAWELQEVDVIHEINKIPYAKLVYADGDASGRLFPISDTDLLLPGAEIVIKIRFEEDSSTEIELFKGIITHHRIEADEHQSLLCLEIRSKVFRMTQLRKYAVFQKQTDAVIVGNLFKSAGANKFVSIETKPKHPEIVQYAATDWDFALARCEANGLWLNVMLEEVEMVIPPEPKENTSADHRFSYGIDPIYRIDLELCGDGQIQSVGSQAWDISKQKVTAEAVADDFLPGLEKQSAAELAKKVGTENWSQHSMVPLSKEEIAAWSNAQMRKSRLMRIMGAITIQGNPNIWPLQLAGIEGTSKRFNGIGIITAVRHRITEGGWFTDIQIGRNSRWFTEEQNVSGTPAASLLPAIHGLQVGIVANFKEDPDGHFQVQVQIPAFGENAVPVWARLATPEAGKDRGYFFYPEPGDEVVVGFFNDDPRQAVILGSMFSQKNGLPSSIGNLEKENFTKGIFSKEGVQLRINDEKKQLTLVTSEEQTVTLDEDGKLIALKDVNGNSITMNEDGVSIKSAKDVLIEASGNVIIKGKKVDVK